MLHSCIPDSPPPVESDIFRRTFMGAISFLSFTCAYARNYPSSIRTTRQVL